MYHLSHTLARFSRARVLAMDAVVGATGEAAPETSRPIDSPSATLLDDLRAVYRSAREVELDWTILLQGARARRDATLALADRNRDEAETGAAWVKGRAKQAAPQELSAPAGGTREPAS